ncbi:MAG TPA: medium chain dehydrogenase/reductase family protein [Candidatus Dormibacteraeota bacterium]|nr:medium chain dehydrogenase/reductase family protein [Candidatus Dormibacteraeota bacterium]
MNEPAAPGTRLEGLALVARENGGFALEEILTAPLTPTSIAIETTWSGVSFGTEFAVLSGKLDWGPFPLVTGYMGAGRVTHVGADVSGYRTGDRVYYRRNLELVTRASGESLNCAAGVHASVAVLDPRGDHGADHIPDNVPDDIASMFVLPAVGLTGVNQARVGTGDTVVVIGSGQIGLSVVAASIARGARVLAVDIRPEPLEAATGLGAHHVVDSTKADVEEEVHRIFGADGVDFVFEATGRKDSIDLGIRLCRQFGCFVWQGNYGKGPVSFDFLPAHGRRLRMVFPCDDGYRPSRRAVMTSLGQGLLKWGLTMTDRIEHESAPAFYARTLEQGLGGVLGASIHWGGTVAPRHLGQTATLRRRIGPPPPSPSS